MLVVAPWVLPDRRARAGARSSGEAPYLTEVLIDEGSPAVGQPLGSAEVFADLELEVLSLERMGLRRTPRPAPETPLEAGDVLRLRGDAAGLRALIQRDGVSIPTQREGGSHALQLVEVVIAPRSSLIGRRLGAVPWAERFSAVPVATRQRGRAFRGLELRTLRAGDVLLLDVRPGKLTTLEQSGAFVLVSEVAVSRFRRELLPFALSILVGVVACATLGLLPIAGAALVGAVLVLLTRCARLDEVVQAIDWNVLMLLAGVLSLGVAMEKTGAAQLFAEAFVDVVGGHGPAFVIAALFLATTILTELLSNTATAALLTPVAIGMASALEIDPRPLVMTIAFGASTAMLTPIGYQTNTLVYGAGQYRFFDFARLGGLLIVPLTLAVTLLVPWVADRAPRPRGGA
ncbi:MAG: SLC13 family permease [Planctomycetota bacterium]